MVIRQPVVTDLGEYDPFAILKMCKPEVYNNLPVHIRTFRERKEKLITHLLSSGKTIDAVAKQYDRKSVFILKGEYKGRFGTVLSMSTGYASVALDTEMVYGNPAGKKVKRIHLVAYASHSSKMKDLSLTIRHRADGVNMETGAFDFKFMQMCGYEPDIVFERLSEKDAKEHRRKRVALNEIFAGTRFHDVDDRAATPPPSNEEDTPSNEEDGAESSTMKVQGAEFPEHYNHSKMSKFMDGSDTDIIVDYGANAMWVFHPVIARLRDKYKIIFAIGRHSQQTLQGRHCATVLTDHPTTYPLSDTEPAVVKVEYTDTRGNAKKEFIPISDLVIKKPTAGISPFVVFRGLFIGKIVRVISFKGETASVCKIGDNANKNRFQVNKADLCRVDVHNSVV